MCGLAGIVARRGEVAEAELLRLREAQRHRGPDGAGLWIGGDTGLAHRRLAIIDVGPSGRQPMATADGRFHVVFNGEIYNHEALRGELENLGHVFASASDTEVLVHGYREWQLGLLDRVRGMFAFALHDSVSGETLLARDPLGIKPLYWADDGARIGFASEIQALRTIFDAPLDPEGVATFLLWGSIAAPRTLYRSIRAVPAGCWVRVSAHSVTGPHAYVRPEEALAATRRTGEADTLRDALLDTVRHHLVADVPVGAFLSGGVDSSALVGLMSEVGGGPVSTVSLTFDVPSLDEGRYARQASRLFDTDHHEMALKIDDVRDRIPEAVRALDQPSIDGINSYFVSAAAARAGLKAVVSGIGGDELFGGYPSFSRVPRIRRAHAVLRAVPGLSGSLVPDSRLVGAVTGGRRRSKVARALAYGADLPGAYFAVRGLFEPADVRRLLAPELGKYVDACDPRADLRRRVRLDRVPENEQVTALEMRHYLGAQLLRDVDAVSMRHSLEVRTPLVDLRLLRSAARVPSPVRRAGPAKRWLRTAPRPELTPALWRRRKQGFTLPFDEWLRSGSLETRLPRHPWLRGGEVARVADEFRHGRLHVSRLWALLVLGEYLR